MAQVRQEDRFQGIAAKMIILFRLLALWALFTRLCASVETFMPYGQRVYYHGDYHFYGCNPEQGKFLISLFEKVFQMVTKRIIPPTWNMQEPTPLLQTFFKDTPGHFVARVLRDAMLGAHQSTTTGQVKKTPRFYCANPPPADDEIVHIYNWCQEDGRNAALAHEKESFIVLCPIFWRLAAAPKPEWCPILNIKGDAYVNDMRSDDIQNTMLTQIVHETVHFYTPVWAHEEKYTLNEYTQLDAFQQRNHPNNYAIYVSSKVFLVRETSCVLTVLQ